jgi:hypothetical protein
MSDIGTALRLEQFSKRYTGMLTVDFYVRAIPPPSLPGADPRSDRFRRGGRESKFLQKSLTKPGANARLQ